MAQTLNLAFVIVGLYSKSHAKPQETHKTGIILILRCLIMTGEGGRIRL